MINSNYARRSFASNATAEAVILITNKTEIVHASNSLKAMAHPLRLKILCILEGALPCR